MRRLHRPLGFTFIELIGAITVLAIAIVPATKYLTESMTMRRRLEWDKILVRLAIQTIEEQMSVINAGFTTASQSGNFSAQGRPQVAYQVIRTDSASAGGVPGLLMAISVKVWFDLDQDQTLDAGERKVELNTKMARSIE